MTVALILEGGQVVRVIDDEGILDGTDVYVVEDGEPTKTLNPQYEELITQHLETARDRTSLMGYGLACEMMAETMDRIARARYDTAADMRSDVSEALRAFGEMLRTSDAA